MWVRRFLVLSVLVLAILGTTLLVSSFRAADEPAVGDTSPPNGHTYAIATSDEPTTVDRSSDDPSYEKVHSRLELVRDGRVEQTVKEAARVTIAQVSWSHDRSAIVWTESGLGADTRLFAARADGSGERLLVSTGGNPVSFEWSPRGHELVAAWFDGYRGHAEKVDALSGASRRINLKGDFAVLRWLPSGLIVWEETGSPNPHYYDIVVTDADGRGGRTVGSGDDRGDFGTASMTADGLRVVQFAKADAGSSTVELHDIASGRTWRLTLRGETRLVSPDGRRLLVAARPTRAGGGGTLAYSLVDITAGTSRRLLLPQGASLFWLPDSRIGFTTRSGGRERLVAVTLTTGARRALVTLRPKETMGLDTFSVRPLMLTLTSGGRRLAFATVGPGYARVASIGVDGGQPRTLAPLTYRSGDDTLSVGNRFGWFLDWEVQADGDLTLATPWEVFETRDEPAARPRLVYRPPAGFALSSYARR
jgi:hypothetical protein